MVSKRKVLTYCIAAAAIILCGCGSSSSRNVPFDGFIGAEGGKMAFLQLSNNPDATLFQPVMGSLKADRLDANKIGTPGSYTSITVSPNGRKIAYEVLKDPGNSLLVQLYTAGSDGRNPVLIADDLAFISPPAFSPDSSKVLFAAEDETGTAVELMEASVDGGSVTPITMGGVAYLEGSYSPDSSRIAASVFDGSRYAIWLLDPSDGSGVPLVTDIDGNELRFPTFSPDGRRVYYTVMKTDETTEQTTASSISYVRMSDGLVVGLKLTGLNGTPRFVDSVVTLQSVPSASVASEMFSMNADGTHPLNLTGNGIFDGYVTLYTYYSVGSSSQQGLQKRLGSNLARQLR